MDKKKIEEIQNICPNNVQQTTSEYGNLMNICYVAKLMIKSQNSIDEYLKSLTYDEMKDFASAYCAEAKFVYGTFARCR